MGDGRGHGLPLYIEDVARSVSDPANRTPSGEWHPADDQTRKLWACVEAMRDIDALLPSGESVIPLRRLKALLVPLESLRAATIRLYDYLCSSDEMKRRLPRDVRSKVSSVIAGFRASSAFCKPTDLRRIRNKQAAHVEKDMQSWSAQEELTTLRPSQFAAALHECLSLVVSALDLDIYSWTASDCPDDCIRLLAVEPSLATLRIEDGAPVELIRVDIVISPRYGIQEMCESLAHKTLWMLPSGDA